MIRCTSALMLACLLGFIESRVMRVFNSEGSPSPPGNLRPGRSPTRSTRASHQTLLPSENPTLFPLRQECQEVAAGWLRPCFVFATLAALREFSLPHVVACLARVSPMGRVRVASIEVEQPTVTRHSSATGQLSHGQSLFFPEFQPSLHRC